MVCAVLLTEYAAEEEETAMEDIESEEVGVLPSPEDEKKKKKKKKKKQQLEEEPDVGTQAGMSRSVHFLSCLVLSSLVLNGPVLACPVLLFPERSNPAASPVTES